MIRNNVYTECTYLSKEPEFEGDFMDYISVREAADKWGISLRRVQKLCELKRIEGVLRFAGAWMIPKDAEKPIDARLASYRKNSKVKIGGGGHDGG